MPTIDKDFWYHLVGIVSIILTIIKMRRDDVKSQKEHHEAVAKIQEDRHYDNQKRLDSIETNLGYIIPWFRDNVINRKG